MLLDGRCEARPRPTAASCGQAVPRDVHDRYAPRVGETPDEHSSQEADDGQGREVPSNHDHPAGNIRDRLRRRDPVRGDAGPESAIAPARDAAAKHRTYEADSQPLPIDLSGIQVDLREVIGEVVQSIEVTQASSWSAPMPEPSVLAEYERVLPGSAERILGAFESVTTKASERDDRITDATVWIRKTGAGWAYFLLLGMITASIVFFALGNPWAGGTLIGAPVLVGLATVITSAFKND